MVHRGQFKITFIPYWNFAMTGLLEMKWNIFFRHVNGNGRINSMKIDISHMSRKNTWKSC